MHGWCERSLGKYGFRGKGISNQCVFRRQEGGMYVAGNAKTSVFDMGSGVSHELSLAAQAPRSICHHLLPPSGPVAFSFGGLRTALLLAHLLLSTLIMSRREKSFSPMIRNVFH